jgi:hypothetical protein
MDKRPIDTEFLEPEPGEPQFNSLDEVVHNIYAERGADMLREVLNLFDDLSREDLEDCAAALEQAGKPSVSAIVMEFAADAPSGIEFNPYSPEDRCNWSEWRRSWLLKRRMQTGELFADLRRYHAQKQQEAQASQQKLSRTRH